MSNKPTEQQIQDFINEILAEWLPFALQDVTNSMAKRGLISSGQLTESVAGDFVKANQNGNAVATIIFETYGRYLDLKNNNRNKPMTNDAIIGVLLEWVKRKGIGAFKDVPGYKSKPQISEDMALKRIAWGIGKGKAKKAIKPWRYAKRKTSLIINLTERLTASYAEVTQKMVMDNLINN